MDTKDMKGQPSWRAWVEETRQSLEYEAAQIKMDFAVALERAMTRQGLSRTALARRLGISPAAVTKALRGDANLTIDSMTKIARAVGASLHVHVAPRRAQVQWFEVHSSGVDERIRHGCEWAKAVREEPDAHATTACA